MINTTSTSVSTDLVAKQKAIPSVAELDMRDYFAAKAMHGMAGSRRYCEVGWDQADMASQAYEIADAMLEAREVKHEQG